MRIDSLGRRMAELEVGRHRERKGAETAEFPERSCCLLPRETWPGLEWWCVLTNIPGRVSWGRVGEPVASSIP